MTFLRRYFPEIFSALAPVLAFWQIVFGGQVLYWGLPALQFVPWRFLVNDAWRAGIWPVWTDLLGMGAPLLANHQSAVFYPPNLLALLIPPPNAISILAVLHLSFAAVGMVRLGRRLGLNDFGAAIVGVTFGLSQYLAARLWFITINNALAWLPWIVLAADAVSRQPTALNRQPPLLAHLQALIFNRQALTLASFIALQFFAGHAQSSFYTLLLAGAWLGWQSLKPKTEFYRSLDEIQTRGMESLRLLIINLFKFLLACLLAACLAAVQLLPTYELLRESPRAAAADYEFAMTYSLWPWRLTSFIAPDLFGHPVDGNYWGYAAYWEDVGYMGLWPLLLALYALGTARRNKAVHLGDIVFLLATIIISIELALGQNTPLYPFFYRYVLFFNLFQAPARMLIWYTFAVSLLAGIGADQWVRSERKRYWSRLGLAGSVLMLILGLVASRALTDYRALTVATSLTGVAALGAVMFSLTLNQPATPKYWHVLAVAFVAVDLGFVAVRLNPTIAPSFYDLAPQELSGPGRTYQYERDEYRVKFKEFATFINFYSLPPQEIRNTLLPNLTVLSQVASANNFDPLLTERYLNYVKAMERNPRLLDLADVQTLIKPMRIVSPRLDHQAARQRIIDRAQIVASSRDALAAISAANFDPDTTLVLEPVPSTLYGLRLMTQSMRITSPKETYLVFSDAYYPGWRVLVDDQPAQLFIADYLFRAVYVSQGDHTLTFEYAPLSFTMGLAVSVIALVVFGFTWWLAQRSALNP